MLKLILYSTDLPDTQLTVQIYTTTTPRHCKPEIIYSLFGFQFGRYSFLGLGVMYGAYHQRRLAAKEVKVREIEGKQKEIRDAKLAIEKKRNQEGKNILHLPTRHFF